MKIAKTGDTYPIICANDYRDRIYTIDYILSAAKTAGYNSVLLLHTMWNHEREFYVIAYIDVVKDNNDIYLYDMQRSGSSILDAGAYMGLTNLNYSNPMVSTSESSDGLQSRGSWTFISTTYQNRTYYGTNYDTYEPIFYTNMSYCNIYINNVKVDMNKSGGAGSGYIGNSLLSNKKMVGYNVPTSSAESTKTESINEASATPVSGKPKIGNGFARIKLLKAAESKGFFEIVSDYNLEISNLVDAGTSDSNPLALMMTAINNPQNRNKIIYGGQSYRKLPVIEDGKIKYTSHSYNNYVGTYLAFPLKQNSNFHGISAKVTITNSPKGNWEMHRLIDTTDDNPIELRFVYNWPDEIRNINLNQETELSSHVGEYYTSKSTHIILEWGYGTWESRDIIITYFV